MDAPEDKPLNPIEEKVSGQAWALRLLTAAERGTLKTSKVGKQASKHLKRILNEAEYHGFPSQLVPLICLHRDAFSPGAQALLDQLAAAMCEQKRPIRAKRFFFDPEEYMDALVTLRLLGQEDIEQDFEDAAHEWIFHEWGWGAHLSDHATRSLLIDLSLLLLLDKNPPRLTETLIARLLRVEESFAGIPRIPTTRNYSFEDGKTFRESILNATLSNPIAYTLNRLGWESHVPPLTHYCDEITTPCFGGAVAKTYRRDRETLGTLSQFPFTHAGDWRLLCNAYPVVFQKFREDLPRDARPIADSSHLQWQLRIREQGMWAYRADLPGQSLLQALGQFPETWAIQRGGEALVLRLYRHYPGFPLEVTDLWSTDETRSFGPNVPHQTESYHQAITRIREAQPGVRVWPLAEVIEHEPQRVKSYCPVVNLWAISLDGQIENVPIVAPARVTPSVPRQRGEEAWDIDWKLPGGLWKVRVDPLAKEPLRKR